ncbi:MAG: helix-turn-helix transcriptional regulator [Actinomycetota bacterium]
MPRERIVAKPEFADARCRAGFNKVELAREIGLGRGQVQLLENGLRGTTSKTAKKIIHVLGVPFDDIFKIERNEEVKTDAR